MANACGRPDVVECPNQAFSRLTASADKAFEAVHAEHGLVYPVKMYGIGPSEVWQLGDVRAVSSVVDAEDMWIVEAVVVEVLEAFADELFSILPFEVPFFEQKHHYPIHYVGNPTAEEVRQFRAAYNVSGEEFRREHGLDERPIIALLAGSRKQEIAGNLPQMIAAARGFGGYQLVLAAAPGIDAGFYDAFIGGSDVHVVRGETYALLSHADTALVTSGTATLETALFRVPQVVCYNTALPKLVGFLRRLVLKVKYVSLVNLIADREVVPELVANTFSEANIAEQLKRLLPDGAARREMLEGYEEVWRKIGEDSPSERTAKEMVLKVKK